MWPIKCGTNLTQAKADDFEAFGFGFRINIDFSSGLTKLPSVQCGSPLKESLPNVDTIPLSTIVDIQSMHLVLVCSPIVFDGDKQSKHQNGKLF